MFFLRCFNITPRCFFSQEKNHLYTHGHVRKRFHQVSASASPHGGTNYKVRVYVKEKREGGRKLPAKKRGGGAWSQGRDVVRIFLGFGPLGRPAGQVVFSGDPCLSRRVERGVVVVVVLVAVVIAMVVVVVTMVVMVIVVAVAMVMVVMAVVVMVVVVMVIVVIMVVVVMAVMVMVVMVGVAVVVMVVMVVMVAMVVVVMLVVVMVVVVIVVMVVVVMVVVVDHRMVVL